MRSIESESADEPLVERVAEEIIQRQRAGEKPTVEEYCARYPDAAEQLRSFLPAILVVEGLKPNSKDQSGSFGSTLEIAGTQKAVIGDYRILSELGRGGMGVVYEAEQQSLGRRVALKVLQRPSSSARKTERRFESEARAAARMHHTNIVPVFDVGSDERHLYYAMQLIQGQSLDLVINDLRNIRSRRSSDSNRSKPPGSDDHHIARSLLTGQFRKDDLADGQNRGVDFDHPSQAIELTETTAVPSSSATSAVLPGHSDLSSAEDNRAAYFLSVAKIGHQTAEALSYAHTRGIIHRDIKPSNLLLDGNGTVWITDFGLAKSGDTDMTHTGDILGTLRYMSPERFKGQCDVRADVYALGLTLYELLVLKLAFDSPDRLTLIEMVSRAELETPRSIDPKIPRDLETIVLKACDQDPKRRYQSADDLADDLQRFIDDEPIQARRASLLERSARWSRHNPWLAASVSIATVALVLIAILSSYAAAVQNRLNNDLSFANSQKDSLLTEQKTLNEELEKTSAQRESMIGELRQSQSRLAEMQAEFVSEKGRFGESMLWLARAYESTDQSDENSRGRLLGKLAVAAQKTPRLLQEYYLHPSNAERSEVLMQARDRSGDRSPMIEMLKNGSTVRDAVVSPDQSLVVTRQMQRDPSSESANEDSSADQGPNGTMRSLWKVWDVERSEYTGQQLLTGDASNLSIAVNAPNRLLAIGELELDPPQPNRRTFEETIRLDGEEKTFTISVWDIDSGKRLFTPIQLSVQSGNTPVSRRPPQVAFRSGGEEMVVAYAKVSNQPGRGAPIFAERFHSRSGKLIESVVIASRGQPIGPGPALFDLSDDGTQAHADTPQSQQCVEPSLLGGSRSDPGLRCGIGQARR